MDMAHVVYHCSSCRAVHGFSVYSGHGRHLNRNDPKLNFAPQASLKKKKNSCSRSSPAIYATNLITTHSPLLSPKNSSIEPSTNVSLLPHSKIFPCIDTIQDGATVFHNSYFYIIPKYDRSN